MAEMEIVLDPSQDISLSLILDVYVQALYRSNAIHWNDPAKCTFYEQHNSTGAKVWNMLTLALERYTAEYSMITKYFL